MPTTRPRYQVTETPGLARALDAAERRWPGEPRSRLLLRLVALGGDLLEGERERGERARQEAITRSGGRYTNDFPPGYLAALREDWPG